MLLLGIAADIGEGQNDDREARRGGFFRRWGRRRLRLGGVADLKRIDPDRLGDVLELGRAEIGDSQIEPPLDLPIGVLGQTDRAGLGDAFKPRGDIDAVAHQIAVGLLDDIAQMDADAELDAAILRHASVALDHGVLNFDGAADSVDHAAELDEPAVAGALDDAPVVHGDGGVDQVAAQRPQPRERAVFVSACEPAVADHVGGQNRCKLSRFGHVGHSNPVKPSTKSVQGARSEAWAADEPKRGTA